MSAKIRVLVIDDEAAILRFLKPALEANNYEMASAGTVAEGIKRIAAETPDIVLLDLGLPEYQAHHPLHAQRRHLTSRQHPGRCASQAAYE